MASAHDICSDYCGTHYLDPEFVAACEPADWSSVWPIVDANGILTGVLFDSGDPDSDEYANVNDLAMVLRSDLPQDEQTRISDAVAEDTWDGYAQLRG